MSLTPVATNFLTQSPSALFKSYDRSATLYSLASKVALVAAIAISTVTMTIVLLGITLSGPCSFLLLGLLLATPFLMMSSTNWAEKADKMRTKATIEKGVVEQLNFVSSWSDERIKSFFEKHLIPPPTPIHSRNLLIARHLYWLQRAQLAELQAEMHLTRGVQGSQLDEVQPSEPTPRKYEELCHQIREVGFQLLETEMLPAILQSALMLQLISNPSKSLNLSDVGTVMPKPIAQRLSERIYDERDVYLIFKNQTREPMGATEIKTLFSQGHGINDVRHRMFS